MSSGLLHHNEAVERLGFWDFRGMIWINKSAFSDLRLVALTLPFLFASAVGAAERPAGVNVGLFSTDHRDAADVVADVNARRVLEARAAGFRLLRLGVPFDAWTRKQDPAEQARVLNVAVATVQAALAAGMTLDIAPFASQREVVCQRVEWDGYVSAISSLLERLPDVRAVGLEALNEPPACPGDRGANTAWADAQQTLYRLIREKLPHTTFVVAGAAWGGVDGLVALDPTPYLKDENTEFTFHYYAPFLFTHQATSWLRADHANKYVHDLDWPVEEKNRLAVETQALKALSSDPDAKPVLRKSLEDLFESYKTEGAEGFPAQQFQRVADWADAHHIARERILFGEFGVRRVHQDGGPTGDPWPTSATWLKAMRDQADAEGFVWAVWNLDGSFGVICGDQPGHGDLCPAYRGVFSTR